MILEVAVEVVNVALWTWRAVLVAVVADVNDTCWVSRVVRLGEVGQLIEMEMGGGNWVGWLVWV